MASSTHGSLKADLNFMRSSNYLILTGPLFNILMQEYIDLPCANFMMPGVHRLYSHTQFENVRSVQSLETILVFHYVYK